MSATANEVSPSTSAEANSKVIATTNAILPQSPRPVLAATEADASAAPCRRCGHPLSAPRSVARGIGPVCLHIVGGDPREAR